MCMQTIFVECAHVTAQDHLLNLATVDRLIPRLTHEACDDVSST